MNDSDEEIINIEHNLISFKYEYLISKKFPLSILLIYYINLSMKQVKYIDDNVIISLYYGNYTMTVSKEDLRFFGDHKNIEKITTYILLYPNDLIFDITLENIKIYYYEDATLIIYDATTINECFRIRKHIISKKKL